MNLLSLVTKVYGGLTCTWLPFWVLTPFRRVLRKFANNFLSYYFKKSKPHLSEKRCDAIVSLTSFPARINDVWKVIECLKRQTVVPKKIILWLSKIQFEDKSVLPSRLLEMEDDLFQIRMVDGDIRSHKKYYYVLKEFPESAFITCDDDVFYDPDMIKRLVDAVGIYPGCIVANHTKQIEFDEAGNPLPYINWNPQMVKFASENRFQIGVGGVIYPYRTLHSLVTEMDVFLSTTPTADDIWLNCMARLNHTKVIQSVKDLVPLPIENTSSSLCSYNNGTQNMNDVQLNNLRTYLRDNGYEDVYSRKYIV